MTELEVDSLFDASIETWLKSLPSYQKRSILQLRVDDRHDPLQIAEAWLLATPSDTAQFGAASTSRVFLDKVVDEIEAFLCGDPRYAAERQKLSKAGQVTHGALVGSIALSIGPVLGVAAVLLSPVVALVLASMGKVTVLAWCRTRKTQRESAAATKGSELGKQDSPGAE